MKQFFYVALLIAFIQVASASPGFSYDTGDNLEDFGVFKEGSCIRLIQVCDNCTLVNITSVIYPNSTPALSQVTMTKSGTEFNYTYCLTPVSGDYLVNGKGDIDGNLETWSYGFTVTPTGDVRGNGFQLMLMISGFFLLCLALYTRNQFIGAGSGFLLMLVGVYTIIYGFQDLSNMYTRSIGYASLGIGLLFTLVSAYEFTFLEKDTEEDGTDDED